MKMCSNKGSGGGGRPGKTLRSSFSPFGAVFAFLLLYLVSNAIYSRYIMAVGSDRSVIFLTSPFNEMEDFSHAYPSPGVGLLNNFGVVSVLLLAAALYYVYYMRWGKRYMSPNGAFLFAVLSTYIASGLAWRLKGEPAAGTSIIGFSALLFIIVGSISDLKYYWGPKRLTGKTLLGTSAYLSFLFLAPILIVFLYVVGNPSYGWHVAGGVLWGALTTFSVLKKRTEADRSGDCSVRDVYRCLVSICGSMERVLAPRVSTIGMTGPRICNSGLGCYKSRAAPRLRLPTFGYATSITM